MENCREVWYDRERKVSVTLVDVKAAAQELCRGHLCGPAAGYELTRALAAAALLGAEMSEREESLALQMKCQGELGGLNVECTAAGRLRGYTEKKLLDAFDGLDWTDGERPEIRQAERKLLAGSQWQVTRTVPGRILSQGISNSLDGYLAGSLQRKAVIFTRASVTSEVEVLTAQGALVELLPDSRLSLGELGLWGQPGAIASKDSPTSVELKDLTAGMELRSSTPLAFGCRCSRERAEAMLAALGPSERATLPPTIDITCHMCGRTFTIKTA